MRLYIAVLLLIVSCSGEQQRPRRIELDWVAFEVYLGMPKQLFDSKISESGYKSYQNGKAYLVSAGRRTYSAAFTNGKLSYADREWNTEENGEFRAVFNGLQQLASRGGAACTVTSDNLKEPQYQMERVFVSCGQREILITITKMAERGGAPPMVDVLERIGHFPE